MTRHMQIAAAPRPFRLAAVALLLLSLGLCTAAQASQRERNQNGRIEVSTTPGGYPLVIDGQPAGETSTTVRLIDLPAGHHTVEILFPNNTRWTHDFEIQPGKRNCISLAYRPHAIELPRIRSTSPRPRPPPKAISSPSHQTSLTPGRPH